jgi:hypothetical protein
LNHQERSHAKELFQISSNPPKPTTLWTTLTSGGLVGLAKSFEVEEMSGGGKGRLMSTEEKARVQKAIELAAGPEEVRY